MFHREVNDYGKELCIFIKAMQMSMDLEGVNLTNEKENTVENERNKHNKD